MDPTRVKNRLRMLSVCMQISPKRLICYAFPEACLANGLYKCQFLKFKANSLIN